MRESLHIAIILECFKVLAGSPVQLWRHRGLAHQLITVQLMTV